MIVLKKYRISFLLIILILILCFIDPPEVPVRPADFDKWVHFLMFLGLSGVIFFDGSFHLKQKVSGWSVFSGSFLFPVVFSGGIEIAQEHLTATRSGDWKDFLFDVIGVCCGYLVGWLINRKLKINNVC